jgi:hypothetical protein
MTTDLAKQETDLKNQFLQVAAETQSEGLSKLLKFAKGKYFVGDDEVKTGHEMLAHVGATIRGWTKFENGKVVEQRIGRISDGFQPPAREMLGDLDKSKWEKDSTGKPRDPWVAQYYLPLEDLNTGDVVVFVTSSKGGIAAVGKLCAVYGRNISKGSPVIKLEVRSYRHSEFGRIETPDFVVASWENSNSGNKAPAAGMNDDIPF